MPHYIFGNDDITIQKYEAFKKSAQQNYNSFRDECNQKYADFLRTAWEWYEGKAPMPLPIEQNPLPPMPYEPIEESPIVVEPTPVQPVEPAPQPKPISPIRENPDSDLIPYAVNFFGIKPEVRLPKSNDFKLQSTSPNSIAIAWESLSGGNINNAIRDCLETRIRYNLCDWAYLLFLQELGKQYCNDQNSATLLTAYIYCQSGYQMRLGEDNGKLVMLFGSKHHIYEMPYFVLDGISFYPLNKSMSSLRLCNASFEGETPLSLYISKEQLLGVDLSPERNITSKRFPSVQAQSQIPLELINFYNEYPSSAINNNPLTRWAMYAETPLASKTRDAIYPALKKSIEGDSNLEAANKLLNWVQTGFVYEYDDKVWGHDRAFFAEETLYYPYADCEDRSILFSRLIRDLLGLDVALIYYPGHLATAVKFNEDVRGNATIIDGQRYIVCDPTYIGAPVGTQMPGLEYDKAEAIVLK